jgi:hypothetical protein
VLNVFGSEASRLLDETTMPLARTRTETKPALGKSCKKCRSANIQNPVLSEAARLKRYAAPVLQRQALFERLPPQNRKVLEEFWALTFSKTFR